jgi:hypothetical protein
LLSRVERNNSVKFGMVIGSSAKNVKFGLKDLLLMLNNYLKDGFLEILYESLHFE